MAAISVPDTFDDITLDWFTAALNEDASLNDTGLAGTVELETIHVDPMDPSKGLIGDLAIVRVTYSQGTGPASFVIKLPAANIDSRNIGTMLGAYAREVAFYRHVAPLASNLRLPVCYYAGEQVDEQRWAIILEEIQGDPFDFFGGATTAMANAAIDALADFHAAWWQSSTRFDWMPGLDTGGLGTLQPLWLRNLPVFVDRYRASLPGPTADWVLTFAPELANWSRQAATEPLTMVHSDYRIDNLMFQGDQVTMIDWQTAMRAPAAMDLSCFITTSLSIENRRAHENELIERYLDRLNAQGIDVDRHWFLRSYDENILWWMGQFGNNLSHLDPNNETVQAGLTAMVNRVYTAAHDRNVGRLL